MVRSEGLEPPTYKFVACCSIQLSYDRTCPGGLYRIPHGLRVSFRLVSQHDWWRERDSNSRWIF